MQNSTFAMISWSLVKTLCPFVCSFVCLFAVFFLCHWRWEFLDPFYFSIKKTVLYKNVTTNWNSMIKYYHHFYRCLCAFFSSSQISNDLLEPSDKCQLLIRPLNRSGISAKFKLWAWKIKLKARQTWLFFSMQTQI